MELTRKCAISVDSLLLHAKRNDHDEDGDDDDDDDDDDGEVAKSSSVCKKNHKRYEDLYRRFLNGKAFRGGGSGSSSARQENPTPNVTQEANEGNENKTINQADGNDGGADGAASTNDGHKVPKRRRE